MRWAMDEKCSNCRFFDGNDDDGAMMDGLCKRYPPIIVDSLVMDGPAKSKIENIGWASCFPEVWSDEAACGEYQKARVSIDDASPEEWDAVAHRSIPPGDR
jgi:hypothetical protein